MLLGLDRSERIRGLQRRFLSDHEFAGGGCEDARARPIVAAVATPQRLGECEPGGADPLRDGQALEARERPLELGDRLRVLLPGSERATEPRARVQTNLLAGLAELARDVGTMTILVDCRRRIVDSQRFLSGPEQGVHEDILRVERFGALR